MKKIYFIASAIFLVSGIMKVIYNQPLLFTFSSFALAFIYFLSGMMEKKQIEGGK
ncbi:MULTISPECIES: hypothetical protein [Shouchella]|uniref:Uncharacterized protein n=1 Tax=Shouchella hunanensis TaxID=766894 RepID=A0ABY7W2W3_9BACI|nr:MULTISPECIES: hypothetical protein [Shouchella]WDF03287.1 hypothetical protein PQ477_17595 [Shouchella hunanensis]